MSPASDFKKILDKASQLKKSGNVDLSLEEDLSLAVMNLVSLEEHFFFTGEKTGKDSYFELLKQTREIRKELLGKMIDSHEGETWCISKHLLAASMRVLEVGTKYQTDGRAKEAKRMFDLSYKIYSLFWAVRLKLVETGSIKKIPDDQIHNQPETKTKEPWTYDDIVTKLVDCCKE